MSDGAIIDTYSAFEYQARALFSAAVDADIERQEMREALSRYGDHDRACDARENALYACTCGFVETVERLFPSRTALSQKEE